MDKSRKRYTSRLEPERRGEAELAQAGLAGVSKRRVPAVTVLVIAAIACSCWITGRTASGAEQKIGNQRAPARTADLPPVPTSGPLPVRWEKGSWWGEKPGDHASISISNAGTAAIILGRPVLADPRYLAVRDLSLAGPPTEPLTLLLLKTGTEHPLHVLEACSVQPNATVRVEDAAFVVEGALRLRGKLDLRHGQVAANSELLIGGSDDAPAEVHVAAGTLTVTNAHHNARLIIGLSGRGDFYLDGGIVEADILQITNSAQNRFIFNAGTLRVRSLCVDNGRPLVIGDGVHPAAQEFVGGTNLISSLLTVTNNAALSAAGDVAIIGPVANYGTIVAGQPGAHLSFASVTNWGHMYMTNGGVLTFQGRVSNHVSAPISGAFAPKPGAGWTVRFISLGGLTHTLEYKNELGEPDWMPLTSTNGTGENLLLTDPVPTDKARYYHIGVTQPQPRS